MGAPSSILRSGGRGSQDGMSCRRREILVGKKQVLLKKLMVDTDHTDYDLFDTNLVTGFDLTGALPESNVFSRSVKPATMSCEDLRRVSDLSRGGQLQSISSSGDPQLDEELYAATMKEVKKGFL